MELELENIGRSDASKKSALLDRSWLNSHRGNVRGGVYATSELDHFANLRVQDDLWKKACEKKQHSFISGLNKRGGEGARSLAAELFFGYSSSSDSL